MLMLFVQALAASVPSEDGGCRTAMPWATLWGATARPSAGQVSSGPAYTPDGWGGPRGVLGGAPNIDATLVSVERDHNYSAFGYPEDFWARPLDTDPPEGGREGAEGYLGQFAIQFFDNNFAAYGLAELTMEPWDYGTAADDHGGNDPGPFFAGNVEEKATQVTLFGTYCYVLPGILVWLWWRAARAAIGFYRRDRSKAASSGLCGVVCGCGREKFNAHRGRECCPHRYWEHLGFCNDLSCDGFIFECQQCKMWRCDGVCERAGAGEPPVLDLAQFLAHSALNQAVRLCARAASVPCTVLLVLINLAVTEAVTCRTCFDQIQGCAGGAACPLLTTTAQNGMLLGGVAAATATALVARDIFPLRFTRVLARNVLDQLLVVGRRPPPGTPVDLSALTVQQLSDPVRTAGAELDALLSEISSRVAAATNQTEIARLNAITSTLQVRRKIGTGGSAVVDMGQGAPAIVGIFIYSIILATRIVRTKQTDVAATGSTSDAAAGAAEAGAGRALPVYKLMRPKSMEEFSAILTVWTMLVAGLGLAPVLVTGAFLVEVVYDNMSEGTITWPVAFELLIVYLEEIERTPGDDVNLSNVYNRGAQDTMLKRAVERAPKSAADKNKDIFRPGADDGAELQWNGSWNRKAKEACITFNLGNKKHPAKCLNERGGCKFNHVCDHWVDDKGPGGTCGGDHPRIRCDNPHKCDKKVE